MRDQPDPTNVNANPSHSASSAHVDDLVRVFNTALVSTRAESIRDFSAELYSLVESPSFRAILNSIKQMARLHGMSDREAAESVIQTFRKLDKIWGEYIFHEGLDRLRNQGQG